MERERITIQNIRRKITCEADAYVYLEDLRWGGRPVCPHCGSFDVALINPANGISRKTRTGAASQRRVWKCRDCKRAKSKNPQFSVTTNTIMHGSKVSLEIWVFILFEMCSNKNGLAAREIERKYGLTAKTAWFITQRIREAMKLEPLAGMLAGTIVADEAWIGGNPKNRHKSKANQPERIVGKRPNQRTSDRTPVMSLIHVETGEVRSRVLPEVTAPSLRKAIEEHVQVADSVLWTDESNMYKALGRQFVAHESVNHSADEYVNTRGAGTNHVEGYFSQLKRSIDGTHHHVSKEHLGRYLAEFDFRYSTRKVDDTARTYRLVGQMGGKRLTYRPLKTRRD